MHHFFYNACGVPWRVRVIMPGDRYGLENRCKHDGNGPMVEFFDAGQDLAKFGPIGQFVARYYLSTLVEHDPGAGLSLDAGVRRWHLDGPALDEALAWACRETVRRLYA